MEAVARRTSAQVKRVKAWLPDRRARGVQLLPAAMLNAAASAAGHVLTASRAAVAGRLGSSTTEMPYSGCGGACPPVLAVLSDGGSAGLRVCM